MLTAKTKTVVITLGALMVTGMVSSLVSGSATYFKGANAIEGSDEPVRFGQTSVLLSDFNSNGLTAQQQKTEKRSRVDSLQTRTTPAKAEKTQRIDSSVTRSRSTPPLSEKKVVLNFAEKYEVLNVAPKKQNVPFYAPVSCEDQDMFTYTGPDSGNVLYGNCIPCPMNKFNVQENTCN